MPDIKTERLSVSNANESVLKGIKEADLSGHLSNGNGKKEKTKKGKDSKKADKAEKEEKKSLVSEDYQLYEALNLLKGMNIMHTRLGS